MIRVETCPDGLLEINIESCPQETEINHSEKDLAKHVIKAKQKQTHIRVIVNKKALRKKVRQLKCKDKTIEEESLQNGRNNNLNIEDVVQNANLDSHSVNYCSEVKIENEFLHEEGFVSDGKNAELNAKTNIQGSEGTKRKPFVCEICNKTISIAANFNRHKRKHEMETTGLQCKVCKKTFTGWNSLRSHSLIHSNIKPYACKYCPKTFRQKNQVTVHMRIHTQERPFVCKYCGASFIQSSAHLAHVRVHEGIRLHHCTYCDKSFTEKGSLNRHIRIHTHERPHACDLCHKLFVDRTGMLRHRRSHTKERPYGCTICPKKFTRKENIRRHIGTAHKDVKIDFRKPQLIRIPPELIMQSRNSAIFSEKSSQM